MWRKIWYEKNTPAVGKLFYLFMFILYAPIVLMVGLPVFLIYKIPQNQVRKAITYQPGDLGCGLRQQLAPGLRHCHHGPGREDFPQPDGLFDDGLQAGTMCREALA